MKFINVLLFILVVVSHASRGKRKIQWECGAEYYTKTFSEQLIDDGCPLAKEEINLCCVIHDACYENQVGRDYCDLAFCDCLQRATEAHPFCSTGHGPFFCNLVGKFGEYAYKLAHPHGQHLLKLARNIWDEL